MLPSLTSTLARFTNLSSLAIYVDIPTTANLFAAQYVNCNSAYGNGILPTLDFQKAEDIAKELFKQALLHDDKAKLQRVEVRILRMFHEDRGQARRLGAGLIVNKRNKDDGEAEFEVVIDKECWYTQ